MVVKAKPITSVDTRLKGTLVTPIHLQSDSGSQPRIYPEDFSGRRIHFMGAGGIGVSALMELCAARGAIVSGCDCSSGGQVAALRAKGIRIDTGHCPSHISECDELVHTAAVDSSHPEVQQAERLGKTVTTRMRMLGKIARGIRSVCVTGAHGKTTTTWLISNILITAGRDPSVLLGGVVKALSGNVRTGRGTEFVAEVDESDNRLHEVIPSIPVLTNIDNDHLDHYGTVDAIEEAATRFLSSVDKHDPMAVLIGCGDDERVMRALQNAAQRSRRPTLSYGFSQHNDVQALNLRSEGLGWRFDALTPSSLWQDIVLPMPGEHNVLNALAAISVAWQIGVDGACVKEALGGIERVGRRFEIKAIKRGIRVVDDYGHHPTEIEMTLRAARASTEKRLGVLFQPHRYTRTAQLMDQFAKCFSSADAVFLMPIYAASEQPIPGIDHHALADAIREHGYVEVFAASSRAEAVSMLLKWAKEGDTLVTQGAGDVTRAADELVSGL
ncbi:MAG TPA: UDP-N-acetylmuramate--L-alanine ligase [Planctomycetota bacterium]|nr:UDP-N-acetylmuramate--L-alanine ligase [Planctomycetota bacterium]